MMTSTPETYAMIDRLYSSTGVAPTPEACKMNGFACALEEQRNELRGGIQEAYRIISIFHSLANKQAMEHLAYWKSEAWMEKWEKLKTNIDYWGEEEI